MERLFNFRRSEALCRLWIATGEQSGLLTRVCGDGKRFVVHADEKLTAFVELEKVTHDDGN
jgi:hypothetical protein